MPHFQTFPQTSCPPNQRSAKIKPTFFSYNHKLCRTCVPRVSSYTHSVPSASTWGRRIHVPELRAKTTQICDGVLDLCFLPTNRCPRALELIRFSVLSDIRVWGIFFFFKLHSQTQESEEIRKLFFWSPSNI